MDVERTKINDTKCLKCHITLAVSTVPKLWLWLKKVEFRLQQ